MIFTVIARMAADLSAARLIPGIGKLCLSFLISLPRTLHMLLFSKHHFDLNDIIYYSLFFSLECWDGTRDLSHARVALNNGAFWGFESWFYCIAQN